VPLNEIKPREFIKVGVPDRFALPEPEIFETVVFPRVKLVDFKKS
jgi:hypothetical protein